MRSMEPPFDKENEVSTGLYYAALGRAVAKCAQDLVGGRLKLEYYCLAVQTLEGIFAILENDALTDPDCFQKIDAISMEYYRKMGVRTRRHQELE